MIACLSLALVLLGTKTIDVSKDSYGPVELWSDDLLGVFRTWGDREESEVDDVFGTRWSRLFTCIQICMCIYIYRG